jgi:hypothetical protein
MLKDAIRELAREAGNLHVRVPITRDEASKWIGEQECRDHAKGGTLDYLLEFLGEALTDAQAREVLDGIIFDPLMAGVKLQAMHREYVADYARRQAEHIVDDGPTDDEVESFNPALMAIIGERYGT